MPVLDRFQTASFFPTYLKRYLNHFSHVVMNFLITKTCFHAGRVVIAVPELIVGTQHWKLLSQLFTYN